MYLASLGHFLQTTTLLFRISSAPAAFMLRSLAVILTNNLFITHRNFCSRLSSSDNDGINANGSELTWIAGSVVLSDNPPQQLKFWRKKFGVKQADLAKKMVITPSVLSDYEKGRRPSPGANFIKRYLQALYELAQSSPRSSSVQQEEEAPTASPGMTADAAVTINQP
jgi:DNA-binding transcriptional regulator YiaG